MIIKNGIVAIAKALTWPWIVADAFRERKRRHIAAEPFPPEWLEILEKNIHFYHRLNRELQEQLLGRIRVFLSEKRFEGCAGLKITDEIKVTVAGYACLLLLNRRPTYYPRLSTILVYPRAYVAQKIQRLGYAEFITKEPRLGESWSHDYVVISWDAVKKNPADLHSGHNVVLHEFAHQLDQENGSADGVPVLESRSQYRAWARVLGTEYSRLCNKVAAGAETSIDAYGATNPAEFFAVITEMFFESAEESRAKHPKVFTLLCRFYRVNPAAWANE
ncbi:MAG TPA: M90 family metallopeptidase [Candidatus Binatia bacterium]